MRWFECPARGEKVRGLQGLGRSILATNARIEVGYCPGPSLPPATPPDAVQRRDSAEDLGAARPTPRGSLRAATTSAGNGQAGLKTSESKSQRLRLEKPILAVGMAHREVKGARSAPPQAALALDALDGHTSHAIGSLTNT